MKKTVNILTTVLLFSWFCSSAQSIPDNIRANNTADLLSDGGMGKSELLYGIPVPPGELVGDVYLSENWTKTTLLLSTDKLVQGYTSRYNIQANQLEIKTSTSVYAIPGSKIKSFVWSNDNNVGDPTYFVNAMDYSIEGEKQSGFLSVLVDGAIPLFKKTTIAIRQPDYKPEFNMGSRDTKILKKDLYYCARNKELIEIKGKNKKKFLEIFGEASPEIEKFINTNDLDITSFNHRVLIFDFYNKKIASSNQ